jgi:hypothetical protein
MSLKFEGRQVDTKLLDKQLPKIRLDLVMARAAGEMSEEVGNPMSDVQSESLSAGRLKRS